MTTYPYPECDPGTVLEENTRYFGEFKCEHCSRWWKSGNSWLGFGQNCTGCAVLTFPWKLSYLQAPPTIDEKDIEKRHPQGKCERCRKLGYYCRDSEIENIQSNRKYTKNRKRRTNGTNRTKDISSAITTTQTISSSANSSNNANTTLVRRVNNSSFTPNNYNNYSTKDWDDYYRYVMIRSNLVSYWENELRKRAQIEREIWKKVDGRNLTPTWSFRTGIPFINLKQAAVAALIGYAVYKYIFR